MTRKGDYRLIIRSLDSNIPVEHRLRAVLKKLLRVYDFEVIEHACLQEESLKESVDRLLGKNSPGQSQSDVE